MSWKFSYCIVFAKPEPSSQSMHSIDCALVGNNSQEFLVLFLKNQQSSDFKALENIIFIFSTILSDS